jgi:lysine-specific demethylase/histidyl-hydroxylase NO66
MTAATTRATTAATTRATTATTPPSVDALALTLAPVGEAAFRDEHWERRPLVVPRAEPHRFAGILDVADVERMLGETGLRVPAFRLVRDGGPLPQSAYARDIPWRPGSFTGSAVIERVAEEFARGATLVLQALHLHWLPAATYCRELEARLRCPVQANAYFTPASAQGFAVHHDTHDVFVLQVAGHKRWRIYEPVLELPLRDQRWSPELGDPGPPVADLTLQAGDTMYLPRGWPHEAVTADAESLHLTIGIHPLTRLDALRAAVESCADDVEFRRSLAADGALPDDLLERLAARLAPEEVAQRARRRFVSGRQAILPDQLAQLRALEGLGVDDPLERRSTVIAELAVDGDGATLVFEGKEVSFPRPARDAVAAMLTLEGPFSAADLPGPLDDAGRLVLVRRLVREGFLRIAS